MLTFVRKSFNKPFELVSVKHGVVLNVEFITGNKIWNDEEFENVSSLDNMYNKVKQSFKNSSRKVISFKNLHSEYNKPIKPIKPIKMVSSITPLQIKVIIIFSMYYATIDSNRYYILTKLRSIVLNVGKKYNLDNVGSIIATNETNNICRYYKIKCFKHQFKAEFSNYIGFKSYFDSVFNFYDSNYNYYYEYVPIYKYNTLSLMENAVFVLCSICLEFVLTIYHEYNDEINTYTIEIKFSNKSKINELITDIIKWFKQSYDNVVCDEMVANNYCIVFSGLECEILINNRRDIMPSFLNQLTHLIDTYEIKDLMLPN